MEEKGGGGKLREGERVPLGLYRVFSWVLSLSSLRCCNNIFAQHLCFPVRDRDRRAEQTNARSGMLSSTPKLGMLC